MWFELYSSQKFTPSRLEELRVLLPEKMRMVISDRLFFIASDDEHADQIAQAVSKKLTPDLYCAASASWAESLMYLYHNDPVVRRVYKASIEKNFSMEALLLEIICAISSDSARLCDDLFLAQNETKMVELSQNFVEKIQNV